jgi:prepilin-type N-terminal cleavage/methylation domain-containing protein
MTPFARGGFTLVELLVVIAIIAVLAAVTFSVTRRLQQGAQASTRLSDMRQSGSMLLALASERNGRCSFFAGGQSTGWDYRPYILLRKELRLPDNDQSFVEIMHWDRKKLPAATPHWACRGTNFQDVTYPDGTTTRWTEERYVDPFNGRTATLKSISLASISRPNLYPLLIDSSRSDGSEIFRINENNGDCVGLREAGGKASAFLFDGSARLMDKADLKKAGFTKAFDNSTTPPTSVTL